MSNISGTPIRSSRFAPAVAGGKDALTYFIYGAVATSGLALGWLGFVAVRPIGVAPSGDPSPVIDVPSVVHRGLASAERQRLVDALTSDNIFAHGRSGWLSANDRVAKAEPAQANRPTPVASPIDADSRVVNGLGQILNVLEKEDLSKEIGRASCRERV